MTFDVIVAARRRTRRLLLLAAAAGLALAAVVCAAGVTLTGPRPGTGPGTGSSAPSGPASTAAALASPAAGAVPVVLPADTTWVSVAGVALPVSATAGPRRSTGGLASGFAHSQAGAVLAAVHLLVRTTPQVGSDVFGPTLREQVVGVHAAAMRAAVAGDYATLGGHDAGGGPAGTLTSALAGVRMASYLDTAARVDLLTVAVDATGTARFAASLVELAWTSGDWALVAPPQGRWDSVVTPVTPVQAAGYPPLAPGR